jgi:ribosomal protein L11 methylase PrmA
MDAATAKQFLISKVIEEAGIEGVTLSDIEKKMLPFTEVNSPPADVYEVNEQFEREYDSDQYEAKIAALLKNARDRDTKTSAIAEKQWKDALESLKKEDHYILVMCAEAFGRDSALGTKYQGRKYLIYTAVLIGIALIWLIKHALK